MNAEDRLYRNAVSLLDAMQIDGFELTAPLDIENISFRLGIRIDDDFSLEAQGIIGQILFEQDTPVIKINPIENSYLPRRRFTIAHEIGHFCLHSAKSKQEFTDSQKTMSRSDSFWNRYESEANGFAAQLLMPKSLIISEGQKIIAMHKEKKSEGNITASEFTESMADRFLVSSKAMEYRLKNLGVLKQ